MTISPGDATPTILSTDKESFVVEDLNYDVEYTFTVSVVDEAGNKADESATLEVPSLIYEENFDGVDWDDSFWTLSGVAPVHSSGVLALSASAGMWSAEALAAGDDVAVTVVMRSTGDSNSNGVFQGAAIEIMEPGGVHFTDGAFYGPDCEIWGGIADGGMGMVFLAAGPTYINEDRIDDTYHTYQLAWYHGQQLLFVDDLEISVQDLADLRGTYHNGTEFQIGTDVPDVETGFTLMFNQWAPDGTEIDSIKINRM